MIQTRTRPRSLAVVTSATRVADEASPGPEPRSFRPALVLALARGQAIERVAQLPEALRDRLTIVTSPRGKYADDRELPLWGDWLELDPDRFYRDALAALEKSAKPARGLGRLKAAFAGPNLDRMRKGLAARKAQVRQEGTQTFFEQAAGRVPSVGRPGEPPAPPWIVALDADDIVLADRLGPSVGIVAPGGLRWLADAWDAAGRPG